MHYCREVASSTNHVLKVAGYKSYNTSMQIGKGVKYKSFVTKLFLLGCGKFSSALVVWSNCLSVSRC